MIEVLTFFNSVSSNKWIPSLWSRLNKSFEDRDKELDDISKIMIGDPVELAKYYVEPDCQEMNPADRRVEDEMVAKQPVMVKIDQFFEQKVFHHGSNQLFILSDAGMGKTALLAMLKLMHLTKFWPDERACILKKLGKGSLEEIKVIENQRKTILLLDSLDEDPRAYGRVKERLLDILEATQNYFKVIITCRTQFFPPTEKHALELPGQICVGPYRCYSKYLSFFNNQKVYEYLSKRFPKRFFGLLTDKKKIEEAKKIIARMGTLRCRPMLLSYIEDLMTSTSITHGASEYHIFNVLLDSWLRREQIKKTDIVINDLHDSCIILAVWMQSHRKREISVAELDKLIEEIAKVKAITQIDMKGRSLLNRNSDGDYRFSHYSIQEFCVAKYISEEPLHQGKSLYRPKVEIPATIESLKMIFGSGKPNPNVESLDLSQFSRSEETRQKITRQGMEFMYIPPGLFKMGSPEQEPERYEREKHHMVFVVDGFYMQTTPVTQAQWQAVMKNNPSSNKSDGDCPVEMVSWRDAQEFIKKLNEKEHHEVFALPTEAQWEYSCRAGTETRYYTGDSEADLDRAGWYEANAIGTTHPVGQKEANRFGLYDMHGNVLEWVEDDWHEDYNGAPLDGSARIDKPRGSRRVIRSGSWLDYARICRSACRFGVAPGARSASLGLRLVLLPGQ